MTALRRTITIEDPARLVLSDLPFRAGQKVSVLVFSEEETLEHLRELRSLLKETQSLPQSKLITEDDIKKEVDDWRQGR
jgi:hypothetical protein